MAKRKPYNPAAKTRADAVLRRPDGVELRGLSAIRQELGPVVELKASSKPAARALKRGFTNEATKERYSRAPDGIHEEFISSYKRERITLPMTLLPVLVGKTIDELHARRTGERPDDPPLRKTRLDRALDQDKTQSLRWALSRYVCDVLTTQETPHKAESAPRVCVRAASPFRPPSKPRWPAWRTFISECHRAIE